MKYIKADLTDVVVSSYDQTKTTIQGRVSAKTIDGKSVLGPPLNQFVDVQTQAAITVAPNASVCTANGRIFTLSAATAGIATVTLHDFNLTTGVASYVGKILITLPNTAATTHTYRSIKVFDTVGTTGWKLLVTTVGTVLINGGTFMVNSIDKSDFVPVGSPTIPFATGNNQKAVYLMQDPANVGVNHLQTVSVGSVMDRSASRLYVHNGVAATHQYYVFDLSVSPTYSTTAITGTEATNTINHAAHTFNNNDPIVFSSLVGGAGLTNGTVYFVRNAVAGVSYEVSGTTGGASINFTTDISSGNVGRAFGTSTANFLHKTGNLPALTGTLIQTDSEDFAQPTGTGIVAIDGFDCAFFPTNTNLYLGKLSELTAGATSWPSLNTVNLLGTPNQITTPAVTYAAWSSVLNKPVYCTGQIFVIKPFANNTIDTIFGGANNKYLEGITTNAIELQPAVAITSMDIENGWLFINNSTTGQRGIMIADLRSDALFDHSYIVTKVLDTPSSVLKFLATTDALYDYTGSLEVYYRTSGFGSISGGWTALPFAEDLTAYASGDQIQFKILFTTLGLDTSIPAQLEEFILGYESETDNSDNWEMSFDDSSNGNPSRTAFRLKKAYASSVPSLRYVAKDLSNVTVVDHDTVSETSNFQYSTDAGLNWSSLGTIPNTVGTLVRYTFNTPPGVDIRPALKEL